MNWLDVVLVLVVLCSVFAGFHSGMARVVIGVLALVAGFFAALWCYRIPAVKIAEWVHNPGLANVLGFAAIFFGALILGSIVASILSSIFKWIGLSWFDRLLGGFAGAVRGALLVAVLADMIVAFAPSPVPGFLDESRVLPYTFGISAWVMDMAPRELKDAFTEQLKTIQRYWSAPRRSQTA